MSLVSPFLGGHSVYIFVFAVTYCRRVKKERFLKEKNDKLEFEQ